MSTLGPKTASTNSLSIGTERAIVALTERELKMFFPGRLRQRLEAALPGASVVDPEHIAAESWKQRVANLRPTVIVSSWAAPLLPAALPDLRYVNHVGGSVRSHVPRALLEQGTWVTNWGNVILETVSEGALSLILAALRRTQHFANVMHREKSWEWAPFGTMSLFDRRVGIHGFGEVARRLLPLLDPFRCDVCAFSLGVPATLFARHGVRRASSLEELFSWADIVIEAEAATSVNHHSVTEMLLRRLRPGSLFVNIARGTLVDEAALINVAGEGNIRVALDVFATEPLPADSVLRGLNNVVLMPHTAGPTDDRLQLCGEYALANIERFVRGEPLQSVITREIYDRST